jgi:hypothetical protein
MSLVSLFSGLSINGVDERTNRAPSRRPLIAPKLRTIGNITDRLSSSDSGASIPHTVRNNGTDKSTTTSNEKQVPINGYATWNRYVRTKACAWQRPRRSRIIGVVCRPVSLSSTRATILPSHDNVLDASCNVTDPSYRIIRCTSMDAVRRDERMSSGNGNDKLRPDHQLKPKMPSNQKTHHHTSTNGVLPVDETRSYSFSVNARANQQSTVTRHQQTNGDVPLQKPRVYNYDDRSLFVNQQQQAQHNTLSSSSASSTLSVKDRSMREAADPRYGRVFGDTIVMFLEKTRTCAYVVNVRHALVASLLVRIRHSSMTNSRVHFRYRSHAVADACNVIGGARGIMDFYGGKLSCPSTGWQRAFHVPSLCYT